MENSNRNQSSDAFYTYRGVTKCLSAGISFLTDNFLYIVKVSLLFSVFYAVVMSALVFITSNSTLYQTIMGSETTSSLSQITLCIILIILYLLLFASMVLMSGLVFRLVRVKSHNIPLKRYKILPTLKASLPYANKALWFWLAIYVFALLCTLLCVIPILIGGEGTIMTILKLGATAVIATLAFVFALPLQIALHAMYLEKGKSVRNVFYGYKKGLKVWGKVFGLSLLVGILVWVLTFLFFTPSLTMISAYKAATLSQLNGDPVQLPTGYGFWYAVILFITYYLTSFLIWIQAVPFAYLFASIKSDEKEEKSILNY